MARSHVVVLITIGVTVGAVIVATRRPAERKHDESSRTTESRPERPREAANHPTIPALPRFEAEPSTHIETEPPVVDPAPKETALDDLSRATATFLTESPDLATLNEALFTLGLHASVIADSVRVHEDGRGRTGKFAIQDSSVQGEFYLSGFPNDTHATVQVTCLTREGIDRNLVGQSVRLDIDDPEPSRGSGGLHVGPEFRPGVKPEELLPREGERIVGYYFSFGPEATRYVPQKLERRDGTYAFTPDPVEPKNEYPVRRSDRSAQDVWMNLLRPYAR